MHDRLTDTADAIAIRSGLRGICGIAAIIVVIGEVIPVPIDWIRDIHLVSMPTTGDTL